MKKALISLLIGIALLVAGHAQAQDKPVLNTAPPAPAPATVPAAPPVSAPAPASQPTPDQPSGLDLPSNRDARTAGGGAYGIGNRLFIYSNFGLSWGGSQDESLFNVSAAPALGYRLTDRFAAGPGLVYSYGHYSGFSSAGKPLDISSSSVGAKVFGQFIVYNEFFLHAEYEVTRAELLVVDQFDRPTGAKVVRNVSTPLVGIGYRNQLSDRAAGDVALLYNFNDSLYSLYSNPVLRFSFLFNLGR